MPFSFYCPYYLQITYLEPNVISIFSSPLLSKHEVEITTLKNERDLQHKRNNMIDNKIAKTSDFRKRYERELGLLEVLNETKQFEKLDKQKFQEENT